MQKFIHQKWLVFLMGSILIISNTCSAPASRINRHKQKAITLTQAQNIADNSTPVRFADSTGFSPDCVLLGWTEKGFITLKKDQIDTLEYSDNFNRLMVRLDKRRTANGVINGGLFGLGLSTLWLLIGLETYERKKDSNDMAGLGLGVTLIYIIPITMITTTGIGALIGYSKYEYKESMFNKDDFASNPWLSMKYYQKEAINELHKQDGEIQ